MGLTYKVVDLDNAIGTKQALINTDQCISTGLMIEADTKWPTYPRRHFQMHFLEWKFWIPIKISPMFVSTVPINNISALVQIIACRHPGDKPLFEPMMVN